MKTNLSFIKKKKKKKSKNFHNNKTDPVFTIIKNIVYKKKLLNIFLGLKNNFLFLKTISYIYIYIYILPCY